MKEIQDLLPYFFKGRNLMIATIALALIAWRAWWLFAKKADQARAKKLILFAFAVVFLAGLAMFLNCWVVK